MRRRIVLLSLVFVTALAVGGWRAAATPQAAPSQRTVHVVQVTLQCGPGADSVSPTEIRVRRGDEIVWELTPESDVERFKIKRKRLFGRWPFRTYPLEGDRAKPPRGNDMKSDASGRYTYEVVGTCRGGQKEVIDPDIIIDI